MNSVPDRHYTSIKLAAAMTAIPERTVRRWVALGQLPAMATPGGRLVALADVERVADALRPRWRTHTSVANDWPNLATAMSAETATVAEGAGLELTEHLNGFGQKGGHSTAFDLVRDAWLQPLVDQLAEAQRTIGRLEAQLAARDAALGTLDALTARVAALEQPQVVRSGDTAGARPGRSWRVRRRRG